MIIDLTLISYSSGNILQANDTGTIKWTYFVYNIDINYFKSSVCLSVCQSMANPENALNLFKWF